MGGRRHRKKEQSSKKTNKNSRAKDAQNKEAEHQQSRGKNGKDIVAYDAAFARSQVLLHYHRCVVCGKQDYFMKACRRCRLAKYCSGECLRKHCSRDEQRFICVKNVIFSNASKMIPPKVVETIFKFGFQEISPHIYSIPRREIFVLMGGPRSVILLQVLAAEIVNSILQVIVHDIDGFSTVVNFHPPKAALNTYLWCEQVRDSIPPQTFILLMNCFWNNHGDKHSAAVDIHDNNSVLRLEHTKEIFKSITKKDADAILRCFQKLIT